MVTGVQGISWTELTITGQSNHAGTTPMSHRHDAGHVAAAIAVGVRALAAALGPPTVGTVGRVELHPNLVNVVAARAVLTVDLRHTDDSGAHRGRGSARPQLCEELAAAEGVTIDTRSLARFAPVQFDDSVIELVERVAQDQGRSTRRMPSGAGHDAQMLARVCPAGMVFVPSAGGVSHNPAEHTDDDQLAAGADVLLRVMLELAGVA